ncbi:MAG: phosphate/phosphite/phosphonate ABC transporter substrate-binding protein [Methylococcales bacterium]|nr:phosphate/phosphite/phosphonate ABC transporter substrate-binding protein [Methylococcales bacterium]
MKFKNIRTSAYFLITMLLLIGTSACSKQSDLAQVKVLRVSIQPIRDHFDIQQSYLSLMKYLEQELKVNIEWVAVTDYQDQLDKLDKGEVDLALLGGYAFVIAYQNNNADPLVMRDVDFRFTSYLIVSSDNKASTIADLKGQSFSFTTKLSCSGHIMPRYFMGTQDIAPESFFSIVRYSGTHDKTAQWVEDGVIDAGVVGSIMLERLLKENKIGRGKIKVLWETPIYPNYVWAARKNLSEQLKIDIIEAFIKLTPDNPQQLKILDQMGAKHYFPANNNDFEPIRRISNQLNMLKMD